MVVLGKNRFSANSPITVRSSKLLVKGVWYKVQFGLFGRKIYLSVDNVINTGISDIGQPFSISKDNFFIGGLPDMSNFPLAAIGVLPIHYTGCLRGLSVDNVAVLFNLDNILDARNVVDCDGTPCGGDVCSNGGTCWLDSFMRPHCSCVPPYYGDR